MTDLKIKMNRTLKTYLQTTVERLDGEYTYTKPTKPFIRSLTTQRDILPKQLRMTIDNCEFKHKNLELINGSYCPLQLLSEEEEAAVLYATIDTKGRHSYM